MMVLCGRPGCRCPTIDTVGEQVEIKDDYGGKVRLTFEEFEMIKGYIP